MPNLPSQRTAGACRTGKFFYFELRVPPRCTASLWVTSLGTRIQCGGTLSPLPSGRDSVGIGGDVQWNGLTVLLGVAPAAAAAAAAVAAAAITDGNCWCRLQGLDTGPSDGLLAMLDYS